MARASDPILARAAATSVVRRLRDAGHTAYFAGGCVRDELLSLRPTDYDVATDATPIRVKELFPRAMEVGAAFGVVIVRLDGADIEVATFRSDGPYSDRRRPDRIHFSDPQTDAQRRDFTVNALFLDPLAAPDSPAIRGHIVDFVGGRGDLDAKILRAVGDPDSRLAEDHLRALRAVRFAARLGFAIDPATAAAIRRHALELRGVSRERIGDELRRMLTHPARAAAAELLQSLGLDAPVLDEPAQRAELPTLAGLESSQSYAVCLAAWALDRHALAAADRPLIARWRSALNLTNDEASELSDVLRGYSSLVANHEPANPAAWLALPIAAQKRSAARPWFQGAMALLAIRARPAAATIQQRVTELQATPGGIAPPPLVTGDDLVAMGLTPGPRFKTILDAVYDAQLENRVGGRPEAMELARKLSV